MKSILKVLIVWMTLLALPLQGFASATMSPCAPAVSAAQLGHGHASMAGAAAASGGHAHEGHAGPGTQSDHSPAPHHHTGKCATCATCGSCVPMAPAFAAAVPASASPSVFTVPFDQQILPSVCLALPDRPPRA